MLIYIVFWLMTFVNGNKNHIFQCLPSNFSIEQDLCEANIAGITIIVLNSTDTLYEQSFGYKSPIVSNQRQLIDSRKTIFILASISKTFISLAAMQLVELNKLNLDNDINQYLSESMVINHPLFMNSSITMRHLLSHTSSIGPNFNEEIKHYLPDDDFIKRNLSETIVSYTNNPLNWLPQPPGTVVHYSNIGASIAAFVIEQITTMRFEEYVQMNILQPLGIEITDASYRLADFNNRKEQLIEHYIFNSSWLQQAQMLLPQLNITRVDNNSEWLYIPHFSLADYPSGLLRMSAYSLSKFVQSFLNNFPCLLLKSTSVDEMIRIHSYYDKNTQFGLIWNWRTFKGKRFIGHRGAVPGVTNIMMTNENRSLAIIMLTNGDTTKSDDLAKKTDETIIDLMIRYFKCFEL